MVEVGLDAFEDDSLMEEVARRLALKVPLVAAEHEDDNLAFMLIEDSQRRDAFVEGLKNARCPEVMIDLLHEWLRNPAAFDFPKATLRLAKVTEGQLARIRR